MNDETTGNAVKVFPGSPAQPGEVAIPAWLFGKAGPSEIAVLFQWQVALPDILPTFGDLAKEMQDHCLMDQGQTAQVLARLVSKGLVVIHSPKHEDTGGVADRYELVIWKLPEGSPASEEA